MSLDNFIHLSTINMEWVDDPGIPGFKQKILNEDKESGAIVRLWFIPPNWGDEVFMGKPDRHYHKTVIERGFQLYGDFPHWEFDSVDDFEGTLFVFKPGLFMDRPIKSLHGLLPEPKSQGGAVILYWNTGSGASVKDSDFNSETVNVPFKEDVDVGINKFSSCKLQNTKDMMWEKHPKIKSWKIKKLSPGSSITDQVNLVFIPPDWVPSEIEKNIVCESKNAWAYVVSGDLKLNASTSVCELKSDDYISWKGNDKIFFPNESVSEIGCTILCSGHQM